MSTNYQLNISNIGNLDPLVFATMPINLPSEKLEALSNRIGLGIDTDDDRKLLDSLIDKTTLKRACCLKQTTIPVKIPIPSNISGTQSDMKKKWHYIEKNVIIPDGFCGRFQPPSTSSDTTNEIITCDKFMDTYCTNVKNDFVNLNGGKFDQLAFPKYSPDCACYGEQNPVLADKNYPPKTYMAGCVPGGSAYLDKDSRISNLTIVDCSILVNMEGTSADSIEMSDMRIENKCSGGTKQTDTTDVITPAKTTPDASTVPAKLIPAKTTPDASTVPAKLTPTPVKPTPSNPTAPTPTPTTPATPTGMSSNIQYFISFFIICFSIIICLCVLSLLFGGITIAVL